jgi:hypothetical protein
MVPYQRYFANVFLITRWIQNEVTLGDFVLLEDFLFLGILAFTDFVPLREDVFLDLFVFVFLWLLLTKSCIWWRPLGDLLLLLRMRSYLRSRFLGDLVLLRI